MQYQCIFSNINVIYSASAFITIPHSQLTASSSAECSPGRPPSTSLLTRHSLIQLLGHSFNPSNSLGGGNIMGESGQRVSAPSFWGPLADVQISCSHALWDCLPSVLWCCWLGGRKCIRNVKKLEWWGAGMVICLERDADLHMAQLMPLPLIVCCFSKIQIGFTFLVSAYPGSPGQRAVERVYVCMPSGIKCKHWRNFSGLVLSVGRDDIALVLHQNGLR